jgi:hypothetical protein
MRPGGKMRAMEILLLLVLGLLGLAGLIYETAKARRRKAKRKSYFRPS